MELHVYHICDKLYIFCTVNISCLCLRAVVVTAYGRGLFSLHNYYPGTLFSQQLLANCGLFSSTSTEHVLTPTIMTIFCFIVAFKSETNYYCLTSHLLCLRFFCTVRQDDNLHL